MKSTLTLALLFTFTVPAWSSQATRHSFERHLRMRSFSGTIWLTELADSKIEIRIRTWRTTRDTVPGRELYPVLVRGTKEKFFFGRFGAAKLPMLIFAVTDPERPEECRTLAYEVSPRGTLIGEPVVLDESVKHGHAEEVPSGRYPLTAIDPKLGAIYSIALQEARFEGFFITYEKLRIRQWDPAISSFIETDEGFLRDHGGRLVQTARFDSWTEAERAAIFAANVYIHRPEGDENKTTKVIPASAER